MTLLKSFLVGILASLPMGPVMILVMQKTLCHGRKSGFISGLGSVATDTFFSCIAVLAVSMVQNFIETYEFWIFIVGGLLLVFLGVDIFFKNPLKKMQGSDKSEQNIRYTIEVALCALANPGALALMLALVAMADLSCDLAPGWLIVAFISLGCVQFWFLFTTAVNAFRRAITGNRLRWANRLAGIAIFLFGVAVIMKELIKF